MEEKQNIFEIDNKIYVKIQRCVNNCRLLIQKYIMIIST